MINLKEGVPMAEGVCVWGGGCWWCKTARYNDPGASQQYSRFLSGPKREGLTSTSGWSWVSVGLYPLSSHPNAGRCAIAEIGVTPMKRIKRVFFLF